MNTIVAAQRTVPKKLDVLETFERIIAEDCTVIHIVTDVESEAYGLFQVLNNRGTNLTEGDLLRIHSGDGLLRCLQERTR